LPARPKLLLKKSNATITNVRRYDPASAMWIGQFRKRCGGSQEESQQSLKRVSDGIRDRTKVE